MGKGDKKTKRGKIIAGSYGVSRPGKNSRLRKEKVAELAETTEKAKAKKTTAKKETAEKKEK